MELTNAAIERIKRVCERVYSKYEPTHIELDDLIQECYLRYLEVESSCKNETSRIENFCYSYVSKYGYGYDTEVSINRFKSGIDVGTFNMIDSINAYKLTLEDNMIDEYINSSYTGLLGEIINNSLTDRERKVLNIRFGLDGNEPMTLIETGKLFNVSGDRIRQIESNALRKLRAPSNAKYLRGYINDPISPNEHKNVKQLIPTITKEEKCRKRLSANISDKEFINNIINFINDNYIDYSLDRLLDYGWGKEECEAFFEIYNYSPERTRNINAFYTAAEMKEQDNLYKQKVEKELSIRKKYEVAFSQYKNMNTINERIAVLKSLSNEEMEFMINKLNNIIDSYVMEEISIYSYDNPDDNTFTKFIKTSCSEPSTILLPTFIDTNTVGMNLHPMFLPLECDIRFVTKEGKIYNFGYELKVEGKDLQIKPVYYYNGRSYNSRYYPNFTIEEYIDPAIVKGLINQLDEINDKHMHWTAKHMLKIIYGGIK